MATLQEMIDDLTFLVGDNSTFWTDQEKAFASNEALAIWQLMTGEFPIAAAFPVTGGIYYNVPKQIMSVDRVLYNDTPLTPASLAELDYGFPGWEGVAGTPVYWVPIGLNLIALSPAPTTGNLTFEGRADGLRLQGLEDAATFTDDVLTALEAYGHHYLVFKEGGQEFKAAQEGLTYLAKAAGTKNQELLTTNFYKQYSGRQRDQELRPQRSGEPILGVRL